MAEAFFDIVFAADPRFPGGTSTALASEVKAARRAGLSAALLPVLSPLLKQARPVHPQIKSALIETGTPMIGPAITVETRFVVLHHPLVFNQLPAAPLSVRAEHGVVVLHHPPHDGRGISDYDPAEVLRMTGLMLGVTPWLAPVGPLVRKQLAGLESQTLPLDWLNLIDLDDWPDQSERIAAPLPATLRIGRHSRPHPPKWPDTVETALAAYPFAPDIHVSMLGADPEALARRYGVTCPAHWRCLPFASQTAADYLATLDAWVYFHGDDWVEAFGRAILEAAACGLPVILPPHFRPLFGPAAIYCRPEEVADTLADLRVNDAARGLQARRARAHIGKAFALESYPARFAAIDPAFASIRRASALPPVPTVSAPPSIRRLGADRILMMSSNGVGLGHLTRLLAIAEADPTQPQPVFFTLSRGEPFVQQAGFPCEFSPFHRNLDVDTDAWNDNLALSLTEASDFHGVGVFVFDGNIPYQGVLDFMAGRPHIRTVWSRRGFWRNDHDPALARGGAFDLILSPGDFADIIDNGPTAHDRAANQLRLPPIWRVPPGPVLSRKDARRALDLPESGACVLISLGSMVNNDLGGMPSLIVAAIRDGGDIPVVLRSPLEPEGLSVPEGALLRAVYPVTPCLAAFDYAVSAAGYNSFHEFTAAGLPTVWLPNEAGEMDRQELRARFAWITGAGEMLRASDRMRVNPVLDRMRDPAHRASLSARARALATGNGVCLAASLLADLSCMTVFRSDAEPARHV
ncbi:MAG: hypothetical protein U0934_19285 [Pseudotabrizicola sp.]|uniref:hypothetical protein n=1 Tax=Pseudotabrizicola sp. TaxID=2939647 RepID=UPI0027311FFE|nr:hypothetical protein [Pseudotabrizicola sp.]MDP2081311.1 hypothetical protein [Pseudotabrizicola sp.]MDZ7576070.1 hypothetical protein [Pseudotabrizicola sp.]